LVLHQLAEKNAPSPRPSPLMGEKEGSSPSPLSGERVGVRGQDEWIETLHSNRNYSPATGKSFETLTPKHFSFNAPAGACPVCHGLGQKLVLDETLIVPDPEKSLEGGAILPWRRGGKRMVVYYKAMLRGLAGHYGVSLEAPYKDLPEHFKEALMHGSGQTDIEFHFWRAGKVTAVKR